jgi:F0F1-type ATP synthase delta subunit
MKKVQIKSLAGSIVSCGGIDEKSLEWICANMTKGELKFFLHILSEEIRTKNVKVFYAGQMNPQDKEKIYGLFGPDKNFTFIQDDASVTAGVRLEYADFVLDCSLSTIIKRILSRMRESI